jgi:uncharacterized protein
MNCPKCGSPMEEVVHQDVRVDRCTHCHGLWFDVMEYERLKNVRGAEAIDVGSPEEGQRMDGLRKIDCPHCQTRMVQMVDVARPDIHYESCPVCNGSFFDAGEFRATKGGSPLDFFRSLFG